MARITIGGSGKSPSGDEPTTGSPSRAAAGKAGAGSAADYNRETERPHSGTASSASASAASAAAGETTRFGGSRPREAEPQNQGATPDMTLAGWLVIVSGPGVGTVLTIRSGLNSLGRSTDADLPLPFGDDRISSEDHCKIIYDPRGRQFSVMNGSGKNLTYLDGELAIERKILARGAVISVGRTDLRFVPFCDEAFEWPDAG